MELQLLIVALVIIVCVLINKVFSKAGLPVLIAFISLGMLFGADGIFKIQFDNYEFTEQICSTALIFIMFYGGFGTKLSQARSVAAKAIWLSTLGVVLTAAFVGIFCHFVLGIEFLESLLIGSIISSTDAASVFSILRSKNLNLKYNTASLLEMESGSNDPSSYMLTIIVLSFMNGENAGSDMIYTIIAQPLFGILFGVVIAYGVAWFMRRFTFETAGFDSAFLLAVAIFSYALPLVVGGNGYLSAYIVGIILGNKDIRNKKALVHFFDGFTSLMQMLIFFLLGLLASPKHIPRIILPALAIALFLTFVARPLVVAFILTPSRSKLSQQLVVSWAGLRGAASIVFAIVATVDKAITTNDVFHITFFIVLFSITIQGTLLPVISRKLNMIEHEGSVLKTFNDYSDESELQFVKRHIVETHSWVGKQVKDIILPPDMLMTVITRGDQTIIPNGDTVIKAKDDIILCSPAFDGYDDVQLSETYIKAKNPWCGKTLLEIEMPKNTLVVMIKRGNDVLIPEGSTIIEKKDILVSTTI